MTEQKTIEQYVMNYLNDKDLDYKGIWPEDIIIDIAGEIAEQMLSDRHQDTEHLVEGKMFDLECDYLTEESQDLFNDYYGEVREYLEDKVTVSTGEES